MGQRPLIVVKTAVINLHAPGDDPADDASPPHRTRKRGQKPRRKKEPSSDTANGRRKVVGVLSAFAASAGRAVVGLVR